MHYFAYGSNMSSPRLLARTPSARVLGNGALAGHQLRFHKIGGDGSAKCDAHETGNADHRVLGVLYRLPADEKRLLDRIEGVGRGYREQSVEVTDALGRPTRAVTYRATAIDPGLQPFDWYLVHVALGARAARLPAAYIENISRLAFVTDPDQERRALELRPYSAAAIRTILGADSSGNAARNALQHTCVIKK